MKFLVYGIEQLLVDNQIHNIIEKNKNYEILNFDLQIDTIESIVEANESVSLFSSEKIIIIKNIIELYSSKFEKKTEILLENLKLNNENIIILKAEILDERKKLTKELKKNYKSYSFSKLDHKELIKFVKSKIKKLNYKMNDEEIIYFLSKIGDNLYIIENELNKLSLVNSLLINKTIIDEVVSSYETADIFDLVSALMNKQTLKSIRLLNELFETNVEVLGIVSLLGNQIRLMYQVKILKELNYSSNDIAQFLEIHPFRVKKVIEADYLHTKSKLLKMLKELARLDIDIKSIDIDPRTRLELFILEV